MCSVEAAPALAVVAAVVVAVEDVIHATQVFAAHVTALLAFDASRAIVAVVVAANFADCLRDLWWTSLH